MSKKLKPCPFCGGPGEVIESHSKWKHLLIRVICKNQCEAMDEEWRDKESTKRAIEVWNTRHDPTKCRKCGGEMKPGHAIEQTCSGIPDFPGDGMRAAEDLREAREAAGLTIADCCRLTGTPRTTWKAWETEAGKGNSRRPPAITFAWLDLYRRRVDLGEP